MRRLVQHAHAPVVAVTPIIAGRALKGPAAKMMRELGQMISPLTVADHFAGLLDGFVLDVQDAILENAVGVQALVTDTLMTDAASKAALARAVLAFGRSVQAGESRAAAAQEARATDAG